MLQKRYFPTLDLLLVFSLFFLSNALVFGYAFWLVPQLVTIQLLFWLVLAALSISILAKRKLLLQCLNSLKQNWTLLPFFVFSGLSIFWSVHSEISFYRWLILLCTVVTGAYIGLRYSLEEFIKLLSVFGVYMLLLSSVLILLFPNIGIMNYYIIQGAWKGMYWHKNHMGLVAVFINILFLINLVGALQSREKGSLLWMMLYLFSLLFIYRTDSVAAYLTAICLHGVIFLALVLLKFRDKIRRVHVSMTLVAFLIVSLALSMKIDSFLAVFNRNTTLTGRIPMWNYLFDAYLDQKPLLGYGFNAFWYIDTHRVAVQEAAGYPDPIIIADNGFIDILINTGYSGLTLFLMFYLGAWWRSAWYSSRATNVYSFFPVILMLYTLLANLSWSLLFENENFFMLVMIAVLFCISASGSTNADGL